MKSEAQTNSRQYFLYLGGLYLLGGLLICGLQLSQGQGLSGPKDHLGLFLLAKGLPLFVCGLQFKGWIQQRPSWLRGVTVFSMALSSLAFGSAMWSSGPGTPFVGDLFLAGMGRQLLEAAIAEKPKPSSSHRSPALNPAEGPGRTDECGD